MASSSDPPPTYHIVPRFDIAANGGALQLGTVVDSLLRLRPLNRGEIVSIPKNLRYKPVTLSGFTETWSRLREGHGGIWAKVFMIQGLGASADASDKHDTQRTVTCDGLVTTYFDPDKAYVAKTLAATGVTEYFIDSGYEDAVYLITGLKVAKKLRFGSTSSTQLRVDADVAGQEPYSGIQVGANAGAAADNEHLVQFEADDIIVGFRVKRYAYFKSSWIPWSKEIEIRGEDYDPRYNLRRSKKLLRGEDYLTDAKMHEEEVRQEILDGSYEEIAIQEELDAQAEAERSGQKLDECWVV